MLLINLSSSCGLFSNTNTYSQAIVKFLFLASLNAFYRIHSQYSISTPLCMQLFIIVVLVRNYQCGFKYCL